MTRGPRGKGTGNLKCDLIADRHEHLAQLQQPCKGSPHYQTLEQNLIDLQEHSSLSSSWWFLCRRRHQGQTMSPRSYNSSPARELFMTSALKRLLTDKGGSSVGELRSAPRAPPETPCTRGRGAPPVRPEPCSSTLRSRAAATAAAAARAPRTPVRAAVGLGGQQPGDRGARRDPGDPELPGRANALSWCARRSAPPARRAPPARPGWIRRTPLPRAPAAGTE
ncbi:hypothetical protein LEMLEM_LOCUS23941 [Lemmus lemmus]